MLEQGEKTIKTLLTITEYEWKLWLKVKVEEYWRNYVVENIFEL